MTPEDILKALSAAAALGRINDAYMRYELRDISAEQFAEEAWRALEAFGRYIGGDDA